MKNIAYIYMIITDYTLPNNSITKPYLPNGKI